MSGLRLNNTIDWHYLPNDPPPHTDHKVKYMVTKIIRTNGCKSRVLTSFISFAHGDHHGFEDFSRVSRGETIAWAFMPKDAFELRP